MRSVLLFIQYMRFFAPQLNNLLLTNVSAAFSGLVKRFLVRRFQQAAISPQVRKQKPVAPLASSLHMAKFSIDALAQHCNWSWHFSSASFFFAGFKREAPPPQSLARVLTTNAPAVTNQNQRLRKAWWRRLLSARRSPDMAVPWYGTCPNRPHVQLPRRLGVK